jgi:PAS domain S-box-containing protein
MSRVALLNAVATRLLNTCDESELIHDLFELLASDLKLDAIVACVSEDGQWRLAACAGLSMDLVNQAAALCGTGAARPEQIVIHQADQSSDSLAAAVRKCGLRTYVRYPLMGGDGSLIGTLAFGSRIDDAFTTETSEVMESVANQAAVAFDRARTVAAARRQSSQRAETERALRESEATYRRMFEHMAQGFFLAETICDDSGEPVDFRYLDANPALEPLTGLKRGDIIGRTVRDVLPDAEPDWIRTFGRVALTGQPARLEAFAAPLGRFYKSLAYSPRPGQFACLFSDVTEEKRAEEALRTSEERLRALISATSDVTYRMNADWTAMLELRGGEFIADTEQRNLDWLQQYIHRDDRQLVLDAIAESVRTGGIFELEHRIVRPDGTAGWISSRAVPVRTTAGQIVEWSGAASDITERKRAEAVLREADRRKDEFIAILSHELRNPLAPIRYAVPVLEREPLSERAHRAVDVINRQVTHLTRLVDDLLDVSRMARDMIELHRHPVTLESILNAAVEAATPAITAARHTLNVSVADAPIWVRADAVRMAQVMTNLLNNSAKYTPRGGHITLDSHLDDGDAVIKVRDNGMGIAAEGLTAIFEMFHQVNHGHTSQGGFGIGLGLAKRIVELHGGTIEARSAGIGRGAEFTVRLPLVRAADEEGPHEPALISTPARRLKVLVVDDNADLVEMLSMVVSGLGHEVRKALDGQTAVSAALAYRPDVVLLDLGLPFMSGVQVAQELRRHPDTKTTRIVALTGWGQEEDRRTTTEAGFDRHLTKPTEPAVLARLLTEFAGERAG